MQKYHKIETLFARDMEGSKKLVENKWRDPTVEFLAPCEWVWTEKVDGTNIRVYWDGHSVTFGGRTDNASIPAELANKLNELFGGEANAQMFEQMFGDSEVILFGEGYGRKIQKGGGNYIPDGVDFILFDVMVGTVYLKRDAVESIAQAMGIKVVPIVGTGSLYDAVKYVKGAPKSVVAQKDCIMEGVVCRPKIELNDRLGRRMIVKIKYEDMKELA